MQSEKDLLGNVQSGDDAILFRDDSSAQRGPDGHTRIRRDVAGTDVFLKRSLYVLVNQSVYSHAAANGAKMSLTLCDRTSQEERLAPARPIQATAGASPSS